MYYNIKTMNFCPFSQYKNILGKPNQGFHSIRLLDTAILDYVGAIGVAMLITWKSNKKIPLVVSTVLTFIGAEFLHMLFGVETNTMKFLGITCN